MWPVRKSYTMTELWSGLGGLLYKDFFESMSVIDLAQKLA